MKLSLRMLAVVAALGLAPPQKAHSQMSFTEITPTGSWVFVTNSDEDFWVTSLAPADVDKDGDLDLAVLGYYVVYNLSADHRLVLLRNEGHAVNDEWVFTEELLDLGTLWAGGSDLAWDDYDSDGDPDLVVGSEGQTALYCNDGGTLALTPTVLPGYSEEASAIGALDMRSISWADYDNDGDLDLLIPTIYDDLTYSFIAKLLRNDGPDGNGGWLFTDSSAAIDPCMDAQSAWADDDGDGDLDLFLANADHGAGGFVRRYRNDGGVFVGANLLDIRIYHGLADWGDYDGDGDMDIVVAGNIQEIDDTFWTVLRLYRNDGGSFTAISLDAPDPAWLDYHAATWADYDSDGDVDLLVTGSYVGASDIEGLSEVYINTGGTFASLGLRLPAPMSSVGTGGAFTWLDIDNDGDLDYLVAGAYYVPGGNGLVEAQMHLYRNDAPGSNNPPQPPGNLRAVPETDLVTLGWNPGPDDHTPSAAITYDLQVFLQGQPAPALRRAPEPGSLGAVTGWKLKGLPAGSYAWSVCAVDSAFNASPAVQGAFTVGAGPSAPPGVPNGANGGTAVKVVKLDPAGSSLAVYWDTTSCTDAVDHHIVWGFGDGLPPGTGGGFAPSGGECSMGIASPHTWTGSPDPALNPSGLVWFLVLANDGAGTEGPWGVDHTGVERRGPGAGGASNQCGMTAKSLANPCGQ